MSRVVFLKGTAAAYQALANKVNDVFYNTTDDNELYFGGKKLTSAADLAAAISRIATNEGDIADIQEALETIQGADTVEGSMRKIAKDLVDALNGQLAAVAKSGAAADVSVADAAGKLDAANVEAALAEIVGMVEDAGTAGAVTMAHTAGTLVYDFYQGGNTADKKIGSIEIPVDMVATAGQVKHPTPENPITIDGQTITSGVYLELTIAHGDPVYVNIAELIEYNDVDDTAEIALDNTNHVITATIVGMNGSKLVDGSVAKTKLDSAVQASLDLADSAVQSVAEGTTNGTIAVDGTDVAVHGLGTAAYTNATAYDAAGAAATAKAEVIGETTDTAANDTVKGAKAAASAADTKAQSALDLIGTIPSTSEADTVIEYVDEKTAGGVSALNGSAGIASAVDGVVTIKAGVVENAGIISNSDGADVVLKKVATSGNAVDVAIADSGNLFTGENVETALQEAMTAANTAQSEVDALETLVGAIPQSATASTVVGYAEELAAAATLEWGSF